MASPCAAESHCRVDLGEAGHFDCAASEDSLLRAALRAGLPWPYECQVGGCGACRFELIEGEVQDLWPEAPGLGPRDRARGKRLACQSRPVSDVRLKVRLDPDQAVMQPAQRQAVTLRSRHAWSDDMTEFVFQSDQPAHYQPGQFALLHLPCVAGPRAYSMSHLPSEHGLWRFLVRRTPQGQGSRTLFEQVQPGMSCELDGPYGHAYFRAEDTRDIVCVAGGSGLGPMLSIARAFLADPGERTLHFYVGLRHQDDLRLIQAMEDLRGHDCIRTTVVLSEPPPDWDGPRGFVHTQALQDMGEHLADMRHYFAGPPPMVSAWQTHLMQEARVPFAQIHFDRFV